MLSGWKFSAKDFPNSFTVILNGKLHFFVCQMKTVIELEIRQFLKVEFPDFLLKKASSDKPLEHLFDRSHASFCEDEELMIENQPVPNFSSLCPFRGCPGYFSCPK